MINSNLENQKGNILLTSILMLIVMNIMAGGLIQASMHKSEIANFKTIDSEVYHLSETCRNDVTNFFKSETKKPTNIDIVQVDNLNDMMTGNETQKQINKLKNYSYSCSTQEIATLGVATGTGEDEGEEIGSTGSEYNGSASIIYKDYYQIESTGRGPDNSEKTIFTIIGVGY